MLKIKYKSLIKININENMSEEKTENSIEYKKIDTEIGSSDLSSDNETSERLRINAMSLTQNFPPLHMDYNKRDRFFSEEVYNNQNINSNFKISKKIKKSLEYLRQLTKEDLADAKKFTLNSH